jgi:hypothetical protein
VAVRGRVGKDGWAEGVDENGKGKLVWVREKFPRLRSLGRRCGLASTFFNFLERQNRGIFEVII